MVNPFHGRNIGWLLRERAENRPDSLFLIWDDLNGESHTWTYGEFFDQLTHVAGGLAERGVRKGDRVCVHMENAPEFVLIWFALGWMGAVIVPTNTRSVADELSYFLAKSGSRAVITQPDFLDVVLEARAHDQWVVVTTDRGTPESDVISFNNLRDSPRLVDPPHVDPMSPAGILFTSGTTSRPKGVVWTHANYLWGGKVSAAHEGLREDDRHLVYLPLFHTNAAIYSILATLWVGASAVLLPRFSASQFWQMACEHRATIASMIPFATRALRGREVPEHTFRLWLSAVGDPPYARYFRVPVLGIWGMTETVTHGIAGEVGLRLARPLAMGVPVPEYDVRVVDSAGVQVAPGETGELEVRGRRGVAMFLEYFEDPAATQAAWTPDGWFRTEDMVRFDPEGTLTFADRVKDMIKVGGENVAASEIERVISEVQGVDEVAVISVPEPMLNEVPYAFVVASGGSSAALHDEIVARCEERLADFKRPRGIEFVADLPRATLDKVAKKVLRERAQEKMVDTKLETTVRTSDQRK